ncbi:GNAT family N-acetyltransferase [Kangiella sediminilitoris]|uniref:GCN5-related N-acetyltransferase n=1 Tax=Kangiella sediminilitoris TaxID=1144748 RepID=A0A1B3BAM3_9GAMM|nr:GNAT family N-acetyltransferase [Kangiella sediminilitoris]AOE49796.1 GCN5-related N-acetyltransferase [Kangiella sediminilitoris]
MYPVENISIPTIETERLILRAYRSDDLDKYYEMMADPDINRFLMSGEPMSRHEAWRSAATMAGHWMLHGFGQWAIEEKSSGEFIGRCGMIEPEGWPAKEIGWVLHKSAWGKGYATEAAKAALKYGFETMKLDKIISLIQPDNIGSVAVAKRIGESYSKKITLFGKDADVYQISKEEFQALKE